MQNMTEHMIKMNINKKERKELLQDHNKESAQSLNIVTLRVGFLRNLHVGHIEGFDSLKTSDQVMVKIDEKIFPLIKDRIKYINFNKRVAYLGVETLSHTFEIKLDSDFSKEEREYLSQFFTSNKRKFGYDKFFTL